MTNTTEFLIPVADAEATIAAIRAVEDKERELEEAKMALYEEHVRNLEDEILAGLPVPWPCMDCGGTIAITKLETLRTVVKGGGYYGHGDC